LNKNFGEFTNGYRVWMLEANREKCTEQVPLVRNKWWEGKDKEAKLIVNVIPKACTTQCELGKRRASATSCACVTIETLPAKGKLFMGHEIAVGTTTRVVMTVNQSVTLREWSVNGHFRYPVKIEDV